MNHSSFSLPTSTFRSGSPNVGSALEHIDGFAAAVFKTVSSSGRVTSVLRQRRSDVSGNRTRGLLDENQTILPSEPTTPGERMKSEG